MSTTNAAEFIAQKPDVVVIITDQERYHVHWPARLRKPGTAFLPRRLDEMPNGERPACEV